MEANSWIAAVRIAPAVKRASEREGLSLTEAFAVTCSHHLTGYRRLRLATATTTALNFAPNQRTASRTCYGSHGAIATTINLAADQRSTGAADDHANSAIAPAAVPVTTRSTAMLPTGNAKLVSG
jgi:hypothetical protein